MGTGASTVAVSCAVVDDRQTTSGTAAMTGGFVQALVTCGLVVHVGTDDSNAAALAFNSFDDAAVFPSMPVFGEINLTEPSGSSK